LLSCSEVFKAFGGVEAVRGAALEVRAGRIVSLIGPNGAGKTTLFNCLTGLSRPDRGEVWFMGSRVDGYPLHERAQRGMARTFQNVRMFGGLTVFESVLVGQTVRGSISTPSSLLRLRGYRREWREMAERSNEILELLGLTEFTNMLATGLPLLQQRKLEVGRALSTSPALLLLDEPTAGATATEAAELMEVFAAVRESGVTILLIEHSMRVVMGASDWVYVMAGGEIVAGAVPAAVQADTRVQEIYLGTPH